VSEMVAVEKCLPQGRTKTTKADPLFQAHRNTLKSQVDLVVVNQVR
jgi:hypothetical protein